ncbi:hypothetical protein [Pseudoalteromonas prydzensis]|uniref:hypothetical protein n=1 Tax=Pseudoalteromonas prydzensis TaxID=182141 RepID=UPI0007E527FF|nr:hypothetical protein [Pseudoalteromonas prydzensis]MBE0377633.1 hypothetical protein [Pseudoalteromonas prydzensis ACAM 620]
MSREEDYIIDFFKAYDLKAEKIPESTEESPDFFIALGDEKILIELKTKIDSSDLIEKREEAFEKGEVYERMAVIGRNNAISKRIRKASSQLMSQKNKLNADYCFVFLLADGQYRSEQLGVFETSLYGDKDIIHMGDDFNKGIKKCYYYTNSDFFNNRSIIDGAFLLGGEFGRLCINSVSENYSSAIKSRFVETFRPGVLCPIEQESKGEAYLIETPIDRLDENALKNYLCDKYNLNKIVPFNWPQITVTSQIKEGK